MSEITEQIGSSIDGLTQEFNIIAHNLANVSTTGYKRRYISFSNILKEQQAGATGFTGEVNSEVTFDFSQGDPVETNRSLDFALCGKGFFVIETPDGPLYTRNGMFRLNQNRQIVDSMGRMVAGENGPIAIPPNVGLSQIHVSNDGTVSSADGIAIGKFQLVDFKDDQNKLVPAGMNCFYAPEDITPEPGENLTVKQGFREASNVKLVEELVDMIMVSRLYEANMKFISAKGDLSNSIIDVAMG